MKSSTQVWHEQLVWPHAGEHGAPEQLARRGYLMQALGLFGGITALIGLFQIYSHMKQGHGHLAESHFRYQIRTFWGASGMVAYGLLTTPWGVGFYVLAFAFFWYFYRVVMGWSNLADGLPMVV